MALSWLANLFHETVMKSDPRLISTAPSYPLEKLLWSIQIFMELSWTLIASSDQLRKLRFWMITLVAPSTSRPPPVIPEPEPTPMTVLFDVTSFMPLTAIMPLTRITLAPLAFSAEVRADAVVTVTAEALPPPVVPAPYPVGVPTATAVPAELTSRADAESTARVIARLCRFADLRMSLLHSPRT